MRYASGLLPASKNAMARDACTIASVGGKSRAPRCCAVQQSAVRTRCAGACLEQGNGECHVHRCYHVAAEAQCGNLLKMLQRCLRTSFRAKQRAASACCRRPKQQLAVVHGSFRDDSWSKHVVRQQRRSATRSLRTSPRARLCASRRRRYQDAPLSCARHRRAPRAPVAAPLSRKSHQNPL